VGAMSPIDHVGTSPGLDEFVVMFQTGGEVEFVTFLKIRHASANSLIIFLSLKRYNKIYAIRKF
jgi:hypothetical protein